MDNILLIYKNFNLIYKSNLIDFILENISRQTFIIIFIALITLLVNIIASWLFKRSVHSKMVSGEENKNKYKVIGHIVNVAIFLIGFAFILIQLPELRIIGHSLLAGAGIATITAGIASQQVLGNVISGVLIIVYKPFRVKDTITINNFTGIVEHVNMRQVILKDDENNRIIIPNSIISTQIIKNTTLKDSRSYKTIEIAVDYSSNIKLAMELISDEISSHPSFIDIRGKEELAQNMPIVKVKVVALSDASVNIKAWFWAKNSRESYNMYCDLLLSIKERFDKSNIIIPSSQKK